MNQEAVCGTCGGDPRDGNGYHAYDCPERTGRTPAPVVPSDDEQVCEYVDPLGKRCGHDAVAHISPAIDFGLPYANYCAECQAIADPIGPQFIHDFAPPTPSQDAEGDRRATRVRNPNGIAHTTLWRYPIRKTWHEVEVPEAVESAIREPYEALVRRGRAVLDDQQAEYECGFCSGSNADHEDECVIPPFAAALTSIEESLGVRKDG